MKTLKISLAVVAVWSGFSFAFGQTWTQTTAPGGILGVASSADGCKLVAVAPAGIYISTNSGATWITNNLPFNNTGRAVQLASSADGNKLALTSFGTNIFTSIDSGATWITNYVTSDNWVWMTVASSADGSILAAANNHQVAPGQSIFESTNSGVTWFLASVPPGSTVNSLGLSANGRKLIAANDGIYTSTDFGTTWISNNVSQAYWVSVATSSEGSRLVAVANPGGIYTSEDSGTTWISNNVPSGNWNSVASSADGSKLVSANGVGIYTSMNSGVTWISNNVPSAVWRSVASSSDGCKMIAGRSSGIWAVQTTPTPQLNLTPSPTNFVISWIIPSTNFVLQQSSDLISWSSITDTPTLNLTYLNNELSISPTIGIGFYRLSTP